MNIVKTPHLLKNCALILSIFGSSLLLTACGNGGDNKNSNSSSSVSSAASSHIFSSASVTPPTDGVWPNITVSASGTKTLKFDWHGAPSTTTYYKLMRKLEKDGAYEQVGNTFSNTSITDAVSVHLRDWLNSSYQVQACDDSGCQNSSVVVTDSAMLKAITYIKASNTDANDWFGWVVAISADGKTMAVSAPGESSDACGVNATDLSTCSSSSSNSSTGGGNQESNKSPNSGAVYVFIKVDGVWQQEAYIKASNTEQFNTDPNLMLWNDRFGYQIALSADGNTLAVTALNEDSPSIGINCDQNDYIATSSTSSGLVTGKVNIDTGAVYIFKRTDGQWSQQAYIKSMNPGQEHAFGGSLALSADGTRLAIGDVNEESYLSGIRVPVSSYSSSTSSCLVIPAFASSSSTSTSSTSSSVSSSDSSASSSSSSSSTSTPGGPNSGAVYLYKLVNNTWEREAFIKAGDAGEQDFFGGSVSLSHDGKELAVGATGDDSKDSSASNDTVLVGDTPYNLDTGAVYVFALNNDTWTQQAKVKPSEPALGLLFGFSVALSGDGNSLAVGAPGDWSTTKGIETAIPAEYDVNAKVSTQYSGSVYVYTRSDNIWTKQSYIKASNAIPGYQFGTNLCMSENGDVLAVSSMFESSLATGINGDQDDTSSYLSGAAYAFIRSNGKWTQKSYIKAPNNDAEDRFGRSLSLDATGESLLIGAYRESSDAKGINPSYLNTLNKPNNDASAAGAVYIY